MMYKYLVSLEITLVLKVHAIVHMSMSSLMPMRC